MDKEKIKYLRMHLGYISLRMFKAFNGVIPTFCRQHLGRIIGITAYWAAGRHRKIAQDSLSIAFPEKSLAERSEIAINSFVFMAQSILEVFYILNNDKSLDDIDIEDKKYLDSAMKKGRGVIIITAHLGNFPLLILKLAKEGYPIRIVVRPVRHSKTGEYFYQIRDKAGIKTIFSYPRRECVSGIIKALKNKEAVIILMDQNFGTGGIWVKFFGKLAATTAGPIILALRTKSVVLPAYIYRKDSKHRIKFLQEEKLIITEDKEETLLLNTIKITRMIENWVKCFPYQWSWIHRRWKSEPSENIDKLKFKIEK